MLSRARNRSSVGRVNSDQASSAGRIKVATDSITWAVRALVARRVGRKVEEVPADAPLAGLGLDSLGLVALIVDLETHFSLRLPATAITREAFHSAATVAAALHGLVEVA
jgi:acyl carrier protein